MYAGRVVEAAPVDALFDAPAPPLHEGPAGLHPDAAQHRDCELGGERPRLTPIPGNVPSVLALPPGCAFAPRCPYRIEKCDEDPPLLQAGPGAPQPLLEA